jgi:hypothetical protein
MPSMDEFWIRVLQFHYTVAYYPFLGSDSETNNETTSAARQQILNEQEYMGAARERLGKHVPAAKYTHATIEVLLETGFSTVVSAEGL